MTQFHCQAFHFTSHSVNFSYIEIKAHLNNTQCSEWNTFKRIKYVAKRIRFPIQMEISWKKNVVNEIYF